VRIFSGHSLAGAEPAQRTGPLPGVRRQGLGRRTKQARPRLV